VTFANCIIDGTTWNGITCTEKGIDGINPLLITPMSSYLEQRGTITLFWVPMKPPPKQEPITSSRCPKCGEEAQEVADDLSTGTPVLQCSACGAMSPKQEQQEEPKPDGSELGVPSVNPQMLRLGQTLKAKEGEAYRIGTLSHWLQHGIHGAMKVEFKKDDIVKVPLGSNDHLYVKRMKYVGDVVA